MSDRLREALDPDHIGQLGGRDGIVKKATVLWEDMEAIHEAARRYLHLTETGQRVEWCETHADKVMPHLSRTRCRWSLKVLADAADKPCRIVSKLLADYLTEET